MILNNMEIWVNLETILKIILMDKINHMVIKFKINMDKTLKLVITLKIKIFHKINMDNLH